MYDHVTFADTAKIVVLAAGSVVVTHLLLNMLVERDAVERRRLCQHQIRRRLRNARRLGRRGRNRRRYRRRVPPPVEEEVAFGVDEEGSPDAGEVAGADDRAPPTEPSHDMERLRDELQAWMQAEQSSGAHGQQTEQPARNPAGVDRSHEDCHAVDDAPDGSDSRTAGRETTLEWVNGRAQARVSGHGGAGSGATGNTGSDASGGTEQDNQSARGQTTGGASLLAPVDETLGCASPKKEGNDDRYQNMMNGGDIGNGLHAWDSMQASYASI